MLAKAASAFFNQVFRDGFFHADLHPGNMFVDATGAIVVVDFGIMGRLDRATRFFLADMLIGFLSGDYRRVAEVHFAAGYVPPRRSIDAFTQACRAIGEPILGQSLQEISFARLLAQLFQVTEQFEMETQPQLLLLQKTMVQVEGMGRRLDPEVNIWTLARPLIEAWMRDNRGPEARLHQRIETLAEVDRPGAAADEEPRSAGRRLVARRDRHARRDPSLPRQQSAPATWRSCLFPCGSSRRRWSRSLSPWSSGGSILVPVDGGGGSFCFRTGAFS